MKQEIHINEERKQKATKIFADYPGKITLPIQEKILIQQVILGMAPNEASMAAGEFAFKVQADPAKWSNNADPYKVIAAQTLHPDNSKIMMTFQNDTQYPGEGMHRFQVVFEKGRVVEINKLN